MWENNYYLHCLVCSRAMDFKCIPSDKVVEGLCDDFITFCSFISRLLKVNVKPGFDFRQEPFPFCQSCKYKLTLLSDYNAQILQLQALVDGLLHQVAADVVESFEDPRNAHFVDNNRVQDVKRPYEISDTFWNKIDEFRRQIFQHFNPWVPVPSESVSEGTAGNSPAAPSVVKKMPKPSQYIFRKAKVEVLETEENESCAGDDFFYEGPEDNDQKSKASDDDHDHGVSSRPRRSVKRKVSWSKILGNDEEYFEKVTASPGVNGEDCVEVEPSDCVDEDWQSSELSHNENSKIITPRKSKKSRSKCSKGRSSRRVFIPRERRKCLVTRIPCNHCHRTFMSKSILDKHMILEHTEHAESSQEGLPSAAPIKAEAESNPGTAAEDVPVDNISTEPLNPPEDLTCHICGKVLKQRYYLNMHLMRHDGIKRHKCQTCNKGFLTKYCLTLHERTHTDERPNTCQKCGKTFKSNSQLTAHKYVHLKDDETAERPFMCEVCPKRFFEKKCLLKHQEIHSSERERTFKCDQCDRAFFHSKALIRHKQTVHNPSHCSKRGPRCQYCDKNFKTHLILVDHLKLHYDGKLPGGNLQLPNPVQLVRVVRKKNEAVRPNNIEQSTSHPVSNDDPNEQASANLNEQTSADPNEQTSTEEEPKT